MMQSLMNAALLDSVLVQAALRTVGLAAVVGAALFLFKVRNPHHQLAAWSAVLLGALAMPLLVTWMVVEVPVTPVTVPAGKIAEPLMLSAAGSDLAPMATVPGDLLPQAKESFDWSTVATIIYAGGAGILLLRLVIGLVLTARIRARAGRIGAEWARGSDIRSTEAIGAPVTVGSTILLPADHEDWSPEKRAAVLLHERAHVARGDFYVQCLAALHRAVFWFSPLAWWLHDRLAELAEDASDAEAASQLPYRADYAAVLLDFAQMPARRFKLAPLGVAMARPATITRRIERVLADKGLPTFASKAARAATAGAVFVLACAAAITVSKVPAQAAARPVPAPLEAPRPLTEMTPLAPARPLPPLAPSITREQSMDQAGHPLPNPHPIPHAIPDPDADLARQLDLDQMRNAIAAARVHGGSFERDLEARIEAAVAHAEARAEAAAERVRGREQQMAAAEPAGPVTRETRNVEAFSGVSFGGAGKVFITVGPKASVVLEADAQTLGRTRTEVQDGVLRIRVRDEDGMFKWGGREVTAYITVPELKTARVSGSGDLKVAGLSGGATELSISGSGSVQADGSLKTLDLDISGSGSAKMEGLVVNDANVAISGSGSAVIDVRNDLDVRVSGSGSVRYLTQPKDVSTSISGSGSVRRRDAT